MNIHTWLHERTDQSSSERQAMDLQGNTRPQYEYFLKCFQYPLKNSEKIVLDRGNYELKTRDLAMLCPNTWLNDMIINYYNVVVSGPGFKEALQETGVESLFNREFVCLNTFLSINILKLRGSYEKYQMLKNTKQEEGDQEGGSFESEEEDERDESQRKELQNKIMKEEFKKSYLRWDSVCISEEMGYMVGWKAGFMMLRCSFVFMFCTLNLHFLDERYYLTGLNNKTFIN